MPRKTRADAHGDMLQGTLDMLVLKTLIAAPAHGHTIANVIEKSSDDVLQVEHGSLYPALHRLEDLGTHRRVLGNVREQPQGEVLPDHSEPDGGTCWRSGAGGSLLADAVTRVLGPRDGVIMRWRRYFSAKQARRGPLAGNRALHRAGDRRQRRARHER